MSPERLPVILVHGWNSHPGAWNRLVSRLDAAGIVSARFDHTGMNGEPMGKIAAALGAWCTAWRNESGWTGPVDMVCHSVGTCIARYYLEVDDGEARRERVRQLIGLGPPNTGSALAELFTHPRHGQEVIDRLSGVFVPRGYDPATDAIVQDVRPGSTFMERLRAAGIRSDIVYRIIVTANPQQDPAFFPIFEGRTWERLPDGGFRQTFAGDGIVAHAESVLPGATLDIIPAVHGSDADLPPPTQFCHIGLTKNPLIMDRILAYLTGSGDTTAGR